ncbi:hypothetical protein QZH41_018727 [Actinostola sp. cb2023]|nr:hypothetical protein QZH41_018727 [Actinostola sp. cb2023]
MQLVDTPQKTDLLVKVRQMLPKNKSGTDYACDVHITSVEDGSPAERAGLRKGDIIAEVNGVKLHGKTHIQAVEIILTTSSPVIFTIKTPSKGE